MARPKFGFEQTLVKSILVQIEEDGVLVTAVPLPEKLPDPDDEPFLEVAHAAGAILVTGNKKHFPPPPRACGEVTVMSPAEFVKLWREPYGSR